MNEKMEKLNVEVTVVVTEKLSLKKEYNRIETQYRNVSKDLRALRDNYNLLHDEIAEINKTNANFRGLIL